MLQKIRQFINLAIFFEKIMDKRGGFIEKSITIANNVTQTK